MSDSLSIKTIVK